jgi:hypothetical protein
MVQTHVHREQSFLWISSEFYWHSARRHESHGRHWFNIPFLPFPVSQYGTTQLLQSSKFATTLRSISTLVYVFTVQTLCIILLRFQWSRGLRLGLRPFTCWNCGSKSQRGMDISLLSISCVFSGRGLWDAPITRPEESYRVYCVWVWSLYLSNEKA